MPELNDIKKEIKAAITKRGVEIDNVILEEIELLEILVDANGVSILESFYDIWKKNIGKTGNLNECNSWLAYRLGMTIQKPLGDPVPSRRAFARAGFPDIDMDFDFFRRQDIYDYIINKYGRESVGNIGTYQGLKLKSSVRRIGKALDVANTFHLGKEEYVSGNEQKVSEIINSLPFKSGAVLKVQGSDGDYHTIKTIEDAYIHCHNFRSYLDKFPDIRKYAKDIEGLLTSFGTHPAGIVIGNEPLSNIAPLRRARKNDYSTQYVYENLEQMGLIKFDILAISTLTVVTECLKLIKQNYDIDIDVKNLAIDDEPTLKLYRTGRLKGVFQCESGAMQNVMRDIGVDRFYDVIAAIALFRPGPMASIPEYCARKRGDKKIEYFHESIEPFVKEYLKDTYGILTFQESLMQVCNSLAGFSVSDGYVMIKAIGKKKAALMKKFEKQFIAGAMKNGVPEKVIQNYWDKFITPFASYGFNIAHSSCYAFLSYITAYLKVNYTDEFFCALLNVENIRKNHDKLVEHEKDAEKFGIKFLSKNINKCGVGYKIVNKRDKALGVEVTEMNPSLMVKGVGKETAEDIDKNGPYHNLRDIAFNTSTKRVDKDTMSSLLEAGFLQELKPKGKRMSKAVFKEAVVNKFVSLREDRKKIEKKGLQSQDMFE